MPKENFIWCFFGKSRMGKTTRALENFQGPLCVCYAPQMTNELMVQRYSSRIIYDTPEYIENLEKYISLYKDILILRKTEENGFVYEKFSKLRGVDFLLDDVTKLYNETWPLETFLTSVGMNNNRVLITTHEARGDVSKKAVDLAVRADFVGPWLSADDIYWLYRNHCNNGETYESLLEKLRGAKWGEITNLIK